MRAWILGVRGSCPTPGADYVRTGGNTSCVALGHDDESPTLVLDAGTGIRTLSPLLEGEAFAGTIILGHLHWDHVTGLPFFRAADHPDSRVRVLLPTEGQDPVDVLAASMSPPHFPVSPMDLRGDWAYASYGEERFECEGFEVLAREIPHKGGRTMGLRVSDGASSLAYLSDHAPQDLGPGPDGTGALHDTALELADGVDLLIHDAQYTAAELPIRGSFGHAAAEYAVLLAREAGAKKLLLFHHDPARTDDEVEALAASVSVSEKPIVEVAVEATFHDL